MTDDGAWAGRGAPFPRRLMLKTLAGAVFLEGCDEPQREPDSAVRQHGVEAAHELESPIKIENRLPGSADLPLKRPALSGEVEGYASQTSVQADDTLQLFVSVNRKQGVRCDVFRIGYYQGLGARRVSAESRVVVAPQPAPSIDGKTGLLECQWDSAFALRVPSAWVTGYYLCKLSSDEGFESYVPFVVRESARSAPLLVQASVTTWQAYNRWGGISLYINYLPDSAMFSGPRGYRVSFDRPYASDADIGAVEHALVRYLEQKGYDVGYVTNVDLDRAPELLDKRRLFVASGHDEYWSLAERNALQDARDAGLSLAFFSGNTAYRRIRLENSSSGNERRVITCYKSGTLDPHRHAPDTTADYQQPPAARPENELVGVLWSGWATMAGFPFVVTAPEHWIYGGTGLKMNDTLAHVVGYEWDVQSDNAVSPVGLQIVGDSLALHEYGYVSRATATVYYPTPSSFVFAAGTIGWSDGLSTPGLVDSRLQRVTENILARAGIFPEAEFVTPSAPSFELGSCERAAIVAGSGAPGKADGPLLSAQFNAPGGVAAGPNGELYVADTGNNTVRKISAAGDVSTVMGQKGQARLSTPTGVAVDRHGALYVSDTNHHRILCLSLDGSVSVFAGSSQGLLDGADPTAARFNGPRGLAVDGSGALFVADFRNNAIRRIDQEGVTTLLSEAGGPTAVAVDADGTLYYLASALGSVVRVTSDGLRSVLANPSSTFGDRSGPGVSAALRPGEGLCIAANGLVFSDSGNNRIRQLAFDDQNTVSTLLGSGQVGAAVGSGAESQVVLPRGLCAFNDGFAVADCANHRILWFSAS